MRDLSDEKFRKLFIGGLHPSTDDDALKDYYSKWGNLTDCVVMRDSQSGKSRKFGFVTYETAEMVDQAQANRPHTINNKTVESKRAMPRSEASNPDAHQTVDRIFVRGLKDLAKEDLEQYFSEYGNVETVDIIKNKETGKSKGFGFVKFDDYDSVDKVLLYDDHSCNGVRIQAKKALKKENMRQMPGNDSGGGYGGYGAPSYNDGSGDWGANYGSGGSYGGNWGGYQTSDSSYGGYGGRDWNRDGGWGGNSAGNNSDWYGGDDRRAGGPMRGGDRDMNRRGPYSGGSRGRGRGFRGGR